MLLYYTVAGEEGLSQTQSFYSNGGFVSSSPVPNDVFDALFSEISLYDLQSGEDSSYICLALKNDGPDQKDITLWFDDDGVERSSSIKVGASQVVNGKTFLNPSPNSKPLGVDFYDIYGQANAIDIGTLATGEWVGLWFERVINKEKMKSDNSCRNVMIRWFAERHQNEPPSNEQCNDFYPNDTYLQSLGITMADLENTDQLAEEESWVFNIDSTDA